RRQRDASGPHHGGERCEDRRGNGDDHARYSDRLYGGGRARTHRQNRRGADGEEVGEDEGAGLNWRSIRRDNTAPPTRGQVALSLRLTIEFRSPAVPNIVIPA